ncbi:MAG: hypothetical protein GXP05_11070 [Alphaproteobacteria bacterium]|nr:hypothetical protein [Alphaproteobacteria bacterium]
MLTFGFINARLIAAVLGSVGAFGALSAYGHETKITPPSCGVEITKSGANLRLEGWVLSDIDAAGSYDLQIRKSGHGGSSTINQSGSFDAKAGQTQTLATTYINGPKDQINATLDLRLNGQKLTCDSPRPPVEL